MEKLFALNIGDDGRVLSATYDEFAPSNYPRVKFLPDGDISNYKYINGGYVYEPLPAVEVIPARLDVIEAQITYTAMMTDTLLEV